MDATCQAVYWPLQVRSMSPAPNSLSGICCVCFCMCVRYGAQFVVPPLWCNFWVGIPLCPLLPLTSLISLNVPTLLCARRNTPLWSDSCTCARWRLYCVVMSNRSQSTPLETIDYFLVIKSKFIIWCCIYVAMSWLEVFSNTQ